MEDYYTHRNSAHRMIVSGVDDTGDIQFVHADGLDTEKFTQIMRVFPHGFSSHSPDDAHMLGLALGGRRDQLLALGGEHPKHRPKNIGKGNTALYNADGTIMKLIGKDWTMDAKGTLTITVKEIIVNCEKATVNAKDSALVKSKRIDLVKKSDNKVITEAGPCPYLFASMDPPD